VSVAEQQPETQQNQTREKQQLATVGQRWSTLLTVTWSKLK
jgi:hypothetical protein